MLGARQLRRALRVLENAAVVGAESSRLHGRILISLALAEAEQGRTDLGFTLLDEAATLLPAGEHGVLLQQAGLMLLRLGRVENALPLLDAAIPLLERSGEMAVLVPTLLNRALVHIDSGRVTPARDDLRRCARLARRHDLPLIAVKAGHNGGLCDLLTGDIPAALAAFAAAGRGYAQLSPGFLPILAVNRAKALLAAGLGHDAARDLDEALDQFRAQRLTQDYAEAALARAQAALTTGDLVGALAWSRRAETRFRARGNESWAQLAGLLRLRVELALGNIRRLPTRALALAASLRQHGLGHDAAAATLLAVRGLIRLGRIGPAGEVAAEVSRLGAGAPLDLRLLWRMTRAELALARGDTSGALSQLRAGLALLHGRRSRLGSLELQVGVAALGVELARTGLDAAGTTRLVFTWSERSRAQAFRTTPVRPSADPQTADDIAELRGLRRLAREAELAGRRDQRALARCAALERAILDRDRRVPGTGHSSALPTLTELTAELARDRRVLVTMFERQGQLRGLVVRDGRAHPVPLGDAAVAREAQRRLLADLDVLAGRDHPAPLAAVVRASIRHHVDVLTAELVAPLRPLIGTAELVLVPGAALSAVPWGLLPDLRGRPVTVAPSASAWYAAARADRGGADGDGADGDGAPDGPPVLVAGPDLRHAEAEIEAIAAIHPGSRTFRPADATVADVLAALRTAPLAHLATHGHHQRDNVLFSRLDLADGPLMAYDVYGLARPPRQVVLSACDVGRAAVHPGEEILGFTTALLLAGTRNVVASVVRVPDDVAIQVMTSYHRHLATGLPPARALAAATQTAPAAAFVCFGAG